MIMKKAIEKTKNGNSVKAKLASTTVSKSGSASKKLNKYGEWLQSREGQQGYIVIKDSKAVLK